MKIIQYLWSTIAVFALIITLLITSIQAVVYWTPGFFEKEYEKYQVNQAVQMEMSDLLEVTDEMMAYLRGNRQDLIVPTIVNGENRDFFNAKEISHMEDVRDLFVAALFWRRCCILFILISLILLKLLKTDLIRILPRAVCTGTGLFLLVIAGLAGVIATDFTKYFTIFHEIFFDNDLWILDPRTDLLINIVPEPFFVDTATAIAILFGGVMLLLFSVSVMLIRHQKPKKVQLSSNSKRR